MRLEPVTSCLSCGNTNILKKMDVPTQMHPDRTPFPFVECAHCGLVYLMERVPPVELGAYYQDYYLPYRGEEAWGKYAPLVERGQSQLDKRRVKIVQTYLPLNKQHKVLDIGCGKPTFLKALKDQFQCEVWGIDFSTNGWKADTQFQNIHLLQGDVNEINLSATFDVITCWHYLEHDYHPLQTLQRIQMLAHKNTLLLLEVPNYQAWSRKYYQRDWAGFHTPRHTAIYSPDNLAAMVERAGWRILKKGLSGTLDPYILWWMSYQEKKNTINWSASMESYFWTFVGGKILLAPILLLHRWSKDIQLLVAQKV